MTKFYLVILMTGNFARHSQIYETHLKTLHRRFFSLLAFSLHFTSLHTHSFFLSLSPSFPNFTFSPFLEKRKKVSISISIGGMSWEDEIVIRDVTNAGLVVSDRIGREVSSQLDLEESLEASRYASHPYSTHPREVFIFTLSFSNYSLLDSVTVGTFILHFMLINNLVS
jgi:hypothetical protein